MGASYYKNMMAIQAGGEHHKSHATFGGVHADYAAVHEANQDFVTSSADSWQVATRGLLFDNVNIFDTRDSATLFMLNSDVLTLPAADFDQFKAQLLIKDSPYTLMQYPDT